MAPRTHRKGRGAEAEGVPGMPPPRVIDHYSRWRDASDAPVAPGMGNDAAAASMRAHENWSKDFHELLDELARNPEDQHAWDALRKLSMDFVYCASTWGRVIIEEAFLSHELKTIQPKYLDQSSDSLDKGAGGGKYEVRGIFFKFTHHVAYDLYKSEESGAKVGGHELRACTAVAAQALSDPDHALFPPLMALVDFRGFRLLAVSHLDIATDRTLVYGSADRGESVHDDDPKVRFKLNRLARRLNLAAHQCRGKTIVTGADVEGHVDPGTGRSLLLDLARLFPPEAPPPPEHTLALTLEPTRPLFPGEEVLLALEIGEDNREDQGPPPAYLFRQLRPSFVQMNSSPLSSDAFSLFVANEQDETEHNIRVLDATKRLHDEVVTRAAFYLSNRPSDSEEYPLSFNLGHFLHQRGINVRFLGLAHSRLAEASPWKSCVKVEMIARAFKSMMRKRWRAVCRMHEQSRPSEEDFHRHTTTYLNFLLLPLVPIELSQLEFSYTKKKRAAGMVELLTVWWERLARVLEAKFGASVTGGLALDPALTSARQLADMTTRERQCLLDRVSQLLGFEFEPDTALPEADCLLAHHALRPLQPSVKHLNLISLAEAMTLQLQVTNLARAKAALPLSPALVTSLEELSVKSAARQREDLVTARALLKESQANQPFSTFSMQRDIATVTYELAIRQPPLSHGSSGQVSTLLGQTLLAESGHSFRKIIQEKLWSATDSKEISRIKDEIEKNQAALTAARWANVELSNVAREVRQPRALVVHDDYLVCAGDRIIGVDRLNDAHAVQWECPAPPGTFARCAALWPEGKQLLVGLQVALPKSLEGALVTDLTGKVLCLQVPGGRLVGELPLSKFIHRHPPFHLMERTSLDRPAVVKVQPHKCMQLAVLRDSARALGAMHDGSVAMWDLSRRTLLSHVEDAHAGSVIGLAALESWGLVATCSSDKCLKLWSLSRAGVPHLAEITQKEMHSDQIIAVAVCEDKPVTMDISDDASMRQGSTRLRVATASMDSTVAVLDIVATRPSSKQAVGGGGGGGGDNSFSVPSDSDQHSHVKLIGHTAAVWTVVFLGFSTLATGSADCSIRLWSLSLKAPLRVLDVHSDDVYCLCYDPLRCALYSSSADGSVKELRFDRKSLASGEGSDVFAASVRRSSRPPTLDWAAAGGGAFRATSTSATTGHRESNSEAEPLLRRPPSLPTIAARISEEELEVQHGEGRGRCSLWGVCLNAE